MKTRSRLEWSPQFGRGIWHEYIEASTGRRIGIDLVGLYAVSEEENGTGLRFVIPGSTEVGMFVVRGSYDDVLGVIRAHDLELDEEETAKNE